MKTDRTTQEHRQEGRGRKVFWILVLVGATVALLGFLRGPGREHLGSRHGHRQLSELSPERLQQQLDHTADRLDLTEQQVAELSRLLEGRLSALQALESDRHELVAEFAAALQSETLDPVRLQVLRGSALALAEQAVGQGVDLIGEAAQVLTPAQREELLRHWRQG